MIEKLRKTWKPMPVTVILGVLAAYYFGITGAFWAVTGEFTRWGASLMKMCGVDISKYSYLKLIHYKGTILTRVDGVMILGMFLGMFIAAALSNNIKFRVPQSMVRVFQAIIGGIIAGFGARLAMGCNLAAFFTGIPQFSFHAWIFAIFMGCGTYVGTKIISLPLFQTKMVMKKNKNGKSKYTYQAKNSDMRNKIYIAIGCLLVILLFVHSFRMQLVLGMASLFGLLFGFLLEKGQICFTSGFRDLWLAGRTNMMQAIIAGMAISSLGTFSFILFGRTPLIFWVGPKVVIGGFLVGVGIVIAGGCETGWMYRAMEGQVHYMLVGLGNVIGSILLVLVWNKIAPVMVYPYPKVNLLKTFGYTGGLVVTYILLGIAFLLTIWWQRFFFKKNKQ